MDDSLKGFAREFRNPIIFTMVVIMISSLAYFGTAAYKKQAMAEYAVFKDIRMKAAFSEDGSLKIFSLANRDYLSKLKASEGKSLPGPGEIVIGSEEAAMMRSEGMFNRTGDTIKGLFGADVRVAGILKKTGNAADMMHFADRGTYDTISGEEGKVFVKFSDEGMPKFFFYAGTRKDIPRELGFSEGSPEGYVKYSLDADYYPVVLGADEARMMREEKLFSAPGDSIKGFFGTNVKVAGVLNKTGTVYDMMHIIPLKEKDLS